MVSVVDETEVTAALKAAKEESEAKAKKLRMRIERAKRIIAGSEIRLERLNADLERRVGELTRSFVNLPPGANKRSPRGGRRRPKGSLDQRVLELIRSESPETTTVAEACDLWNGLHPENEIGRGTLRGILDRLAEKEQLVIVEEGGPGRSRSRVYRLSEINLPEREGSTEAIAH
jgi:hypothetical protein